jgi:hypothetical protein
MGTSLGSVGSLLTTAAPLEQKNVADLDENLLMTQ